MAVGCIEPQFFAEMLSKLGIDPQDFGPQNRTEHHAEQHKKLETLFASKTRDEWAVLFDGSDACVFSIPNGHADAEDILTSLGYDADKIASLSEGKVIG